MTSAAAADPFTVIVCGGGLGGLCLAHALAGPGPGPTQTQTPGPIRVVVLERDESPTARAQGVVIGLRQEGVDALLAAGLGAVADRMLRPAPRAVAKEDAGTPTDLALADERGRALVLGRGWMRVRVRVRERASPSSDSSETWRSSLVDRASLRAEMAAALPADVIRWGARVVDVRSAPDHVAAVLADGTEVRGHVLVGAEGARSALRSKVAPSLLPRGLGLWNVAGVVPLGDAAAVGALARDNALFRVASRSLMRMSGRDSASMLLFSPAPVPGKERILLWALSMSVSLAPNVCRADVDPALALRETLEIARTRFDSPQLVDLVARTPLERVMPGYELTSVDVATMKRAPRDWVAQHPRVTFLGDAAHKTTTQAGLGATGAFLDALDLASAIRECAKDEGGAARDPAPRIRAYETEMYARAVTFVGASVGNSIRIHAVQGPLARAAAQRVMWFVGCIISAVDWVRSWWAPA